MAPFIMGLAEQFPALHAQGSKQASAEQEQARRFRSRRWSRCVDLEEVGFVVNFLGGEWSIPGRAPIRATRKGAERPCAGEGATVRESPTRRSEIVDDDPVRRVSAQRVAACCGVRGEAATGRCERAETQQAGSRETGAVAEQRDAHCAAGAEQFQYHVVEGPGCAACGEGLRCGVQADAVHSSWSLAEIDNYRVSAGVDRR